MSDSKSAPPLGAVLGALVAVGVVSFFVGRLSVGEPKPVEVVRYEQPPESERKTRSESLDAPVGKQGGADDHAGHDHGAHDHGAHGAPPAPQRPRTPKKYAKPVDFNKAFAAVQNANDLPDSHEAAAVARQAAGELEQRLLNDPEALKAAIARFPTLEKTHELELLAVVLGRVRDPEVEELGLRHASDSTNPARQAAAFDLLDALDTPKAKDVALSALQRERDTTVRRAALRAVPPASGASEQEADDVVRTLTQILDTDPDRELRRRAAVMLGTWHRTLAELNPVMQHLVSDQNVNVRAGCAFGLELSKRRDSTVINVLVGVLNTQDEDPLVRTNAARALEALSPLPAEAHRIYQEYKSQQDALGEATGEGG